MGLRESPEQEGEKKLSRVGGGRGTFRAFPRWAAQKSPPSSQSSPSSGKLGPNLVGEWRNENESKLVDYK